MRSLLFQASAFLIQAHHFSNLQVNLKKSLTSHNQKSQPNFQASAPPYQLYSLTHSQITASPPLVHAAIHKRLDFS